MFPKPCLNKNAVETSHTLDTKYSQAFNELNGSMTTRLDDNVQEIKTALDNIGEADSTWQVAWNGFKALGSTLKLPISLLTTSMGVVEAGMTPLDYIPTWVKTLSIVGITALIVFLILSLLKGENKM